jgi:hypothetical protein
MKTLARMACDPSMRICSCFVPIDSGEQSVSQAMDSEIGKRQKR